MCCKCKRQRPGKGHFISGAASGSTLIVAGNSTSESVLWPRMMENGDLFPWQRNDKQLIHRQKVFFFCFFFHGKLWIVWCRTHFDSTWIRLEYIRLYFWWQVYKCWAAKCSLQSNQGAQSAQYSESSVDVQNGKCKRNDIQVFTEYFLHEEHTCAVNILCRLMHANIHNKISVINSMLLCWKIIITLIM